MNPATDAGRDAVNAEPVRRRARRLLTLMLGAVMALLALSGCSTASATAESEPSYGSLPTYLPSAAIRPDSELTGTTRRPALTTEGDQVEIQFERGVVHATVTGPDVPGEGLPQQQPATTCTWTITLTGATTTVPVDVSDFTTLDHLGTIYHPTPVVGQPQPPTEIRPGETVTFQLRAVMRTGEGLMRWAPGHSAILASWDFEVETD